MKTRLIAIALCLVMVSTVAATGAVSAKTTLTKSNTLQYDIVWYGTPIGKLTIDLTTGYYTVNVNYAKIDDKDWGKALAGESGCIVAAWWEAGPGLDHGDARFGKITMTDGGTCHGEGYVTDAWLDASVPYAHDCIDGVHSTPDILTWLQTHGSEADFVFMLRS